MKVVVLAAGAGVRFHPHGGDPKGLLPLGEGETILSRLAGQLLRHIAPRELLLVVGYQHEKIVNAFPRIPTRLNPHFSEENTAKSLERALEDIDDDVVWINGDVVCVDDVIERTLSAQRGVAVVSPGPTGEEEVKYTLGADGNINAIGKDVSPGEGEAVGINTCPREQLPLLKKALAECTLDDYFERAMQKVIDAGGTFAPLAIGPDEAVEVDFEEDLARARTLL